jgi:hypothetical protein
MSALDKLDQLKTQMQRMVREYQTKSKVIGTDRDSDAHRKVLSRLRERFAEIDKKAGALLSSQPTSGPEVGDWQQIKQAIRDVRSEFEAIDRDVRSKENAHRVVGAESDASAGAKPAGGHTTIKMQDFKQIDDAELLTEEALQNEKLKGILDVERDMNELHSMYHELHGHVHSQQTGLDTAETNIDSAQSHVEKGVVELKQANKLQKSSRKKMFILLAIIAVVIIVAIIVIVVVTKKD